MNIGCVIKVVKGGRWFCFNVLVVVGNKNGFVGFGLGKVKEVFDVIKKVVDDVFKNLIYVMIKGMIIVYDIEYKYNVSCILFKLVSEGMGVIVGGLMRFIVELVGIKDILIKFLGFNNFYNVVCVIFDVLVKIKV